MFRKFIEILKKLTFAGKKNSDKDAPYAYLKEDIANEDYEETPVKEELNSNENNINIK